MKVFWTKSLCKTEKRSKTMFLNLNQKSDRRFPYYFDGRVARADLARNFLHRRIGLFLVVALISLSWLPLENYFLMKAQEKHQLEKRDLLVQVQMREWETQHIYELISSFDTGLNENKEKKLTSLILKLSDQYQLDPYLILAVIKTESFFNHRAISVANARGLMQILPPVGAELAEQLRIPFVPHHTLFDPEENVRMGTHYLIQLIHGFQGNLELALIAYNRGPNHLRRAIYSGKEVPTQYSDWVLKNYQNFLRDREQKSSQIRDHYLKISVQNETKALRIPSNPWLASIANI
jgi:hypothetical protein